MNAPLDRIFDETGTNAGRQLMMMRAALAGIPISRVAAPDALREAAWALEGLSVGMETLVDSLSGENDHWIRSVCLSVRVNIVEVKRELLAHLWDLPKALVRARSLLLRSVVLLSEIHEVVARRRGQAPEVVDALEVARTVVMIAVRESPTDSEWIVLVAYAEIALLALVPRERFDQEFMRKLTALRTLLSECTNYESRQMVRQPSLATC